MKFFIQAVAFFTSNFFVFLLTLAFHHLTFTQYLCYNLGMAESMTSENSDKRKLVAEFFSNIGVAWFAAGVIGVFVNGVQDLNNALFSIGWGVVFGVGFLFAGMKALKI